MFCKKNMSFEECELTILRAAVDKIGMKSGKIKINNPEIKQIIEIVEIFLQKTKRICYGGTAINNILPLQDQFYDKTIELPDYDFFSPNPVEDAKKLGATIVENTKVVSAERIIDGWKIILDNEDVIFAKILINAGGIK